MSYSIIPTSNFQREFKKLNKKYPSIKSDLIELINSLQINPQQGSELFKNCYKVRMAIRSKGKGKSGGSRVIFFTTVISKRIYLLSIYDKSSTDSISDEFLRQLLKDVD